MARRVLHANESYYSDGADGKADLPGYIIATITEGQPGYHVYSYGFQTVADAQKVADEGNELLGHDRDTVLNIVASSMSVSDIR